MSTYPRNPAGIPAEESQQRTFRFGAFELNPHTRELRKNGVKLKLQDQPFQVLLALLEKPGVLLTREEIQKRLWPENTHVDFDNAINSAVRKLRDAFGDSADNPRFIETLARRGYRFIAPIDGPPPAESGVKPRVSVYRQYWLILTPLAVLILVAVIVIYERQFAQNAGVNEALPPPVPLTSYPGFQWSPSFSPDGTRVAFTWDEPGKRPSAVYVKLIGPSDPIRLTFGNESDFSPVWSADGRFIAFLRTKGPYSTEVMLIPSLGGTPRPLANLQMNTARLVSYSYWTASPPFLAWSANGKWLLGLDQSGEEKPAREAPVRIVRISAETGEKSSFPLSLNADRNMLDSKMPVMSGEEGLAVSPDGRKLAFLHTVATSNTKVYLVELTNDMLPAGPARAVYTQSSFCKGISWQADGTGLIVSSDRRGPFELWRIPFSDFHELSRVNLGDDRPTDVVISRAGGRIAYTHSSDDPNIFRIELKGGRLQDGVKFISSTRNDFFPRYSPDGKRVAFESNRFGSEEIWVADADGSSPMQITSFGKAWSGSPSWSPDGQWIAFDSNVDGQWEIYLVPSQGGKPRRLTSGAGAKIRPSWSHDGQWIYFGAAGDNGPQIWKKPVSGGAETQVTRHAGRNQAESLDGQFLYWVDFDGSALWRAPVTGGEEIEMAKVGRDAQFALGKHGVYFTSAADANTLKLLDYASASIKTLGTLPGPSVPGLSVSPDERFILFGKADSVGSQLMLVEGFR